ncbi:uncharacterized protein HD556DRAFT_1524123 [Suillus plorans]|uniref:Uncharacterized protein n=1 Tax=Suillus plorans TaxID=116603 RepID=A0A9P7DSF1_9AGAM|nr:uncharacterized protein HD556DRAFT_1524123 [Suillus plorans]KAG1802043.1 hypothetical protein HD556DRAFT_1524123 [Suillus plorans]
MSNLPERGMFSSAPSRTPFCLRTLLWLTLSSVRYPKFVSARPTSEVLRRASDDNTSDGNSISASVWIPVLILAVVVAVLTLVGCVRRATNREVGAAAVGSTPAGQAASTRPGRRRRPARTPSQISTKSLPPYMLEPGDQELVLFRAPPKTEDDQDHMPILEEDEEHPETGGTHRGLDLESHGTIQADSSATNLIYNVSGDVSMRRSIDAGSLGTSHHSQGSHSELLPLHTTQTSEDPRGEAPPYFEVVGQDTVHTLPDVPPASETSIDNTAPDRRSRFSFLFKPFGSSSRYPPLSIHNRAVTPEHTRNVSSLSVASTTSGHGRNRSSSNSTLLKALRPHDHSTPMTSPSTISLNSISAPLTHTVMRSEFRAPKGGMTPEQIKLITSRNALERFGVPYGPDAVAFSASRSNMAPPPDFDVITSSLPDQASGSLSADIRNPSGTSTLERETTGSPVFDSAAADEAGQTTSRSVTSGSPPYSPSGAHKNSQVPSSPRSLLLSSYQRQGDSRSSSTTSFETAASEFSRPTTPLTARPETPTARPFVA